VLLVEDNAVNQMVAVTLLQKAGCRVDVANNGREGVEAAQALAYDIVFMDCQMPEMDGYEATAEIRRREGATRHTPIVAMTANALERDRERCLAAGMDDYVSKPVRVAELRTVIDRWLAAGGKGPPADAGARHASDEILDVSILDDLWQVTPTGFHELVRFFLESAGKKVEALRTAAAADDRQALLRLAHAFKGSAGNLGAAALAARCAELEEHARGADAEGLGALVRDIEEHYARARQELEKQSRSRRVTG
jgi:CheY-like chemotaxis protein/HPt (histidine-containing phosphotransfer) domain-containing protein